MDPLSQSQVPTNLPPASQAANPNAQLKEKERISETASVLRSQTTESTKNFTAAKAIPDDIDPVWKGAIEGNWKGILSRIEGLDPNIAPKEGPNAGKSILWLAADQRKWKIFKILVENLKEEDVSIAFAASPKMGPDAGKSVLWLVLNTAIKVLNPPPGFTTLPDEDMSFCLNTAKNLLERFASHREATPKEGVDKGRSALWLFYELSAIGTSDMADKSSFLPVLREIPTDLTLVSHTSKSKTSETLYAFLLRSGIPRELLLKEGKGNLYSLFRRQEKELAQEALERPYFNLILEGLKQGHISLKDMTAEKAHELLLKAAKEKRVDFIKDFLLNSDFNHRWITDNKLNFYKAYKLLDEGFIAAYDLNLDPNEAFSDDQAPRKSSFIEAQNAMFQKMVDTVESSFDILAFDLDPYKENPFRDLPLEARISVLRNALRESFPWIDQVKDKPLVRGLTRIYQLQENKKPEDQYEKAFDWLIRRMYGTWRVDVEGIDLPDAKRLSKKDLSRLIRQSIEMVEKEHNVKLMLQKPFRDALVSGFADFEKPLTRKKMIALIKSVSEELGLIEIKRDD